jgi:8-oxo-dGTP pyrophosphatase MutT (NUDIX family)
VTELPPAIPAATLVIFRDRANGPPELLMVERAKAMAFAGGALVFPGGRVDPHDRALAETLDGDVEETAHRIAAIRETIEEAGLAIGLRPPPAAAALAAMRAALHAEQPFGAALADIGAAFAIDDGSSGPPPRRCWPMRTRAGRRSSIPPAATWSG